MFSAALFIGAALFGLSSCSGEEGGDVTLTGNGITGTWEMESMLENMHMDGSIFECQIMQGGQASADAMNTNAYTKYTYVFRYGGNGTVSTEDTDGNMMENTPIAWTLDMDAKTLSITTDVFVEDTRVYTVKSMSGNSMKLVLDHTYPDDDEFDRGGQRLEGTYTLNKQ